MNLDNLAETANKLQYSFPENLPISAKVDEIKKLWQNHQVIILGGATGSGKTTQLPKIALEIGRGRAGRICCTQPRRIAAMTMARRVSEELKCTCGQEVGYQVRFDDRSNANTVIKFVTDGVLLAQTHHDKKLLEYDTIIIDEAHERSLNIDFLMGYLKKLTAKRSDLKIAISSATLDLQKFSEFFNDAPIIEVEGKTYPVENIYLPPIDNDEDLEEHLLRAVEFINENSPVGDILVFLPGEREINDCKKMLEEQNYRNTEILPLYARLSSSDQQKVFKHSHKRRIILSTNVAETSVTIPNIKYCIDSGLARISRYNVRTCVQELKIERISKASIKQRSGRCGRTSEGVALHLYSENDFERAEDFTAPEIHRTSLAGVILKMLALNLGDINKFPFIDPPSKNRINEGIKTLEDLELVTHHGTKLTKCGYTLAKLPIDPHLGKMIAQAAKEKVVAEVIVICAFLSIMDVRERPLEKEALADAAHKKYFNTQSDFLTILNLYSGIIEGTENFKSHGAVRRFAKANFLNYRRILEWQNLINELFDRAIELDYIQQLPESFIFDNTPYEQLHSAILSGIPRQFAKFDNEKQLYLSTANRKFTIFPGSSLFSKKKKYPEWIISFAIVESSKVFGRMNAEIRPSYIERVIPHICKAVYDKPQYDPNNLFVYANKKLMAGGLTIVNKRRVHYGNINPIETKKIFIREAFINNPINIPSTFVNRHFQKLASIKKLELKLRKVDTLIDTEAIFDHYMQVLPPDIFSGNNLKKFISRNSQDYSMPRNSMIYEYCRNQLNEQDYPDFLTFNNQKFKLNYKYNPGEADDGIFLMAEESKVDLLPSYALDYLVPGYLADKIELMLKSLPKVIRQRLTPLSECCAEFISALKNNQLFTDNNLANLLCEFLNDNYNVELFVRDFENCRLPEYLKMKLIVLDENNREIDIFEEMPNKNNFSSKISVNSQIIIDYTTTGESDWRSDLILPESYEISDSNGKKAYLALIDECENSIGSHGFLNLTEAQLNHRKGIIRLFNIRNREQIKFIKRTIKLPREVLLSFFVGDSDKNYLDDLMSLIIEDALGGNLWSDIRSPKEYSQHEEQAIMNLGESADLVSSELIKIYNQYEKITALLKNVKMRLRSKIDDLEMQLDFLFAHGFLKRPDFRSNYPRYLRAIQIRLERLNSDYAKDCRKLESIETYITEFHNAVADRDDITESAELYEFYLLLEESRIMTFTPEIPLKIKNAVTKLAQALKNLPR